VSVVLIVDADPEFGSRLAQIAIEVGGRALPVTDTVTAGALVAELRVRVDVLRRSQGRPIVVGLAEAPERGSAFVSEPAENLADCGPLGRESAPAD